MKSVICGTNLGEHVVEPYRFRVLGSAKEVKKEIEEVESEKPLENESVKEHEVLKKVEEKNHQENSFVEELLKKTDELSSNIIKLQMKIENQEAEFEKRLQEELIRTKEASFKEGEEKAKKDMAEKMEENAIQVQRTIHLLEEEKQKLASFLSKTEKELSMTAIDVAKEVIKKEVSQDSSQIALSLAKVLMKELSDATKIEIRVNPYDYNTLKESLNDISHVKVGTDDAIAKGGVIVLSDVGNLDGNLMTRLEKIKQVVHE